MSPKTVVCIIAIGAMITFSGSAGAQTLGVAQALEDPGPPMQLVPAKAPTARPFAQQVFGAPRNTMPPQLLIPPVMVPSLSQTAAAQTTPLSPGVQTAAVESRE